MQDRQKLAVDLLSQEPESVLDLGCRDKKLKEYLPKNIKYQGIDIVPEEEVMVYNLEKGIPFGDKSFDAVFAIEVLEHLENIHLVFEEMLRVAKKDIVIALPNMNHWIYRIRHFLGKEQLVKYTFYPERHQDRHRWHPTHKSSIKFVEFNAKGRKVDIGYGICLYKKLKFLKKADQFLSRFFPELFVYTDFFHIKI